MTTLVELQFTLTGVGWVAGHVQVGDVNAEFSASYLSNALGGLVGATVKLLQGAASERVSFDEEPGEYRWVLARDQQQLHLQLLWFDELWGGLPDDKGVVRMTALVELSAWASAVKRCCDRLLAEHGLDGYHDKWVEAPFPLEGYLALSTRLGSAPHEAASQKTRKRKLRNRT